MAPQSVEVQLALLLQEFKTHCDISARTHGELAGDILGVQARVASLESKQQTEAMTTGQWKLEQVREERDKLAEANRHWLRYVIGVLVTVVILLAGAGLGMLIRR